MQILLPVQQHGCHPWLCACLTPAIQEAALPAGVHCLQLCSCRRAQQVEDTSLLEICPQDNYMVTPKSAPLEQCCLLPCNTQTKLLSLAQTLPSSSRTVTLSSVSWVCYVLPHTMQDSPGAPVHIPSADMVQSSAAKHQQISPVGSSSAGKFQDLPRLQPQLCRATP